MTFSNDFLLLLTWFLSLNRDGVHHKDDVATTLSSLRITCCDSEETLQRFQTTHLV